MSRISILESRIDPPGLFLFGLLHMPMLHPKALLMDAKPKSPAVPHDTLSHDIHSFAIVVIATFEAVPIFCHGNTAGEGGSAPVAGCFVIYGVRLVLCGHSLFLWHSPTSLQRNPI